MIFGTHVSAYPNMSFHKCFMLCFVVHYVSVLQYNRGRYGPTWARQGWVFGLLEVHSSHRRPILKMVRSRAQRTLIPIIRKYVKRGSTIYSDSWRAYVRALNGHGYQHYPVNHSENFVDPNTGSHTQHIERAWQTIKGQVWRLRGNRSKKMLRGHLKIIEWTYWLGKRHRAGILGRLINDIKRKYKV